MKRLLLSGVLLLLPLCDVARGQESCDALKRGDNSLECCNTTVDAEEESRVNVTLAAWCKELQQASSPACRCLREKVHGVLQSAHFSRGEEMAGVKVLLVNASRAIPRDVVFSFFPLEGPKRINKTGMGNTSKIRLPRKLFESLSSQKAHVVVTVLDITQLVLFKETEQTRHILDNTVVGITVGDTKMTGLQDPAQITFAHGQLPRVSQPFPPPAPVLLLSTPPRPPTSLQSMNPQCVFWDPGTGQGGGWNTDGCVTELGDKGTICSCDHLTFFTLLLSPTLDGSTARALKVIANVGCGLAVTFSVFSVVFYVFLRCTYKKFKSEEAIQINLALHMKLIISLFLLNLTYLFNNWISSMSPPGLCKSLGGLTHYCQLFCFTWMALEGCHLYLLFVKVPGTYIHHYLLKLCIVVWGKHRLPWAT